MPISQKASFVSKCIDVRALVLNDDTKFRQPGKRVSGREEVGTALSGIWLDLLP